MRLLKTFLLLVFLAFCLPVYSQTDTVASRYVGPGVKHLSITFPSIPWKINVLEVDITNPFITLETVKASKKWEGAVKGV